MTRKVMLIAYWVVAAVTFAGAVGMVFGWVPDAYYPGDDQPVVIQRILYFHLPVAINTFLACTVTFAGGIGYLATRRTWWDDVAAAGAKVAVVLCTGVLLTGMLWAKGAWGLWWTWSSPRLTFSFMLWVLYVVYLVVRGSVEGAQKRAVVCAVYGLIAYLDIPLVYLSARLIPDTIHPPSVTLAPEMKVMLAVGFVPVTLLAAGLVVLQYQVHRRRRVAAELKGGAA